jgi:hypothetical protein
MNKYRSKLLLLKEMLASAKGSTYIAEGLEQEFEIG